MKAKQKLPKSIIFSLFATILLVAIYFFVPWVYSQHSQMLATWYDFFISLSGQKYLAMASVIVGVFALILNTNHCVMYKQKNLLQWELIIALVANILLGYLLFPGIYASIATDSERVSEFLFTIIYMPTYIFLLALWAWRIPKGSEVMRELESRSE